MYPVEQQTNKWKKKLYKRYSEMFALLKQLNFSKDHIDVKGHQNLMISREHQNFA